jgi:prepilin-type N-terminal cleavage/methylation domain-containing protein
MHGPSVPARLRSLRSARGFTLIELMITLVVLALVVGALTVVLYSASHNKTEITQRVEATQMARVAIDMMAHDIRCAGYGADETAPTPQPAIAYVDSLQILVNANFIGDIGTRDTTAYDPAGSPKPYPLNGTAWAPSSKYRTGAEMVRWTLDVNNDGVIDSVDWQDSNGIDAQRSPNPQDYELVRQVYGDSTNDVAGNNGPWTERVALVKKPGNGTLPMFQVYMKGMSTPYDWANGPVPVARLNDIQRVTINVTAASSKPDSRGQYASSTLSTTVNSLRNIPDFGQPEYGVSGYVFNDLNSNHNKDVGEPGIPNTSVKLGPMLQTYTDGSGFFMLRAPAGSYALKHTSAAGYQNFTTPDSFVCVLPPGTTHNFADVATPGGFVTALVFNDINGNGTQQPGEDPISNVLVSLTPPAQTAITNSSGKVRLFANAGAWSCTVTAPESSSVTSPNPFTSTMLNGDSASIAFGILKGQVGTISGSVYTDNNKNGVKDAGEAGIQNVWVGITPDGGLTVKGYAYTDASGNYSISNVPINDPPHTQALYAMAIVPTGFFPTTTTSIGPIWLQDAQTISGQNFGMSSFQRITLNASRVLSLASGDLIEQDYNGNQTQNARDDADLVLGADAGGSDNISVWFNQYDSTPLFAASADYTRLAPQSVTCMALDTLDASSPKARLDLVTGTKLSTTPSGNFFVWFNQGNPNEGFFANTYSAGQNYRTNDQGDVQAVLTMDCAGGAGADQVDIIVGTKSPTAGQGTFEVWMSNNAATPTYSRQETYPSSGGIPGNVLGEVTAMALADIDGDGRRDLIVGTHTTGFSGQVMAFKNVSKVNGLRFIYQTGVTLATEAVTSLACGDFDGDGKIDVVVGTQTSATTGHLIQYRNLTTAGVFAFSNVRSVDTPGFPMSLAVADMGGSTHQDIICGTRADAASFVGALRLYFMDSGLLPLSPTDPSAGTITNMVPALTINNFNYGVKPVTPLPPYLSDFAVGVKVTATTGNLVVFVR